jgi:hypothetical protein
MPDTIKVPYGDGIEDAVSIAVPLDTQAAPFGFDLQDGTTIRGEVLVLNVFRLLNKTDDKGEPIYLFTIQVKTKMDKESTAASLDKEG